MKVCQLCTAFGVGHCSISGCHALLHARVHVRMCNQAIIHTYTMMRGKSKGTASGIYCIPYYHNILHALIFVNFASSLQKKIVIIKPQFSGCRWGQLHMAHRGYRYRAVAAVPKE